MAEANEKVRLEVGFDGGQIMGALVSDEDADALEEALQSSDARVFDLEAEDGRYVVALGRIVYVKRFSRESPVGFGGR